MNNNRRRVIPLVLSLLVITGVASTSPRPGPDSYRLGPDRSPREDYRRTAGSRPPSNSIIDLEISGEYLWAATGKGLGRYLPPTSAHISQGEWFNIGPAEGFGNGGVSGLAVGLVDDTHPVVWAATAIDTTISGTDYAAGGGVGFSLDEGESWFWMPQPVDEPGSMSHPTTISVQNVTYDIAVLGNQVWIASWAGGLRRLVMDYQVMINRPEDLQWENRPPDTLDFHVIEHLNHRAFSIAVMDTLLWVGTAGGINLSRDRGETWNNFRYSSNNEATPTGNFVPALGAQMTSSGKRIIWAGTWAAEGEGEYYGVSKSEDYGVTWQRVLGSVDRPVRAHNFAFDDSIVYVATDQGLHKSADYGGSWGLFPRIHDIDSLEFAFEPDIYSVAVGFGCLWAGGPEGLAVSPDAGNSWRLMRTFARPEIMGAPETYAYPNPFSPDRFGAVRFQYRLDSPGPVTLEIYDFAMELLIRPVKNEWRPAGDRNESWDGYAPGGRKVANGVYFYRIEGGGRERWGKILVLD